MKKIINYSILTIFTVFTLGMIIYIAWTGKDPVFAKYVTGITALISLWYSVRQNQKNAEEREAKVLVHVQRQWILLGEESLKFVIKNNSNIDLINVSIKFSERILFGGENLEDQVQGWDLAKGKEEAWHLSIEDNNAITSHHKISYVIKFNDARGNRKKLKGKVINRLPT
ncbi:hypothetical protein [Priestia megaterium]|uniref:hypothetical protein n=1 Tax=Priestia megaterium TaxID=1404 RepID=UPI001F130595|nr:hypothetical protein [Priestia megaterium]UMZ36010.1 hypothetical protein MGJ28_28120 [Priestia megaterium]